MVAKQQSVTGEQVTAPALMSVTLLHHVTQRTIIDGGRASSLGLRAAGDNIVALLRAVTAIGHAPVST